MSKWHHIDTAPKDGTEIIIASWGGSSNGDLFPWWLEETNWQTSASGEGECWLLTAERMNAHTGSFPATHWMPMPTLEAESVDAARDGVEREARNEPTSSDVERMREALEWYGEQARLARLIHSEGDAGRHALAEDGGKRARAILAERSAARSEPSTAGWLPISTAPKDGTRILTKLDHPVTPVQIARWQHLEWRLDNNNWPCYPLGWQPLPPPSQEGASEGEGQT
jgi:hypothetical protein